jgi:hypothetical protein
LSHGQEDADLQRARIYGLVWTSKKIVNFGRSEVIFTQGDLCESVMYIQHGGVKLSVLSTLSEMVGTTRSRVEAGVQINSSLLSVVLHD